MSSEQENSKNNREMDEIVSLDENQYDLYKDIKSKQSDISQNTEFNNKSSTKTFNKKDKGDGNLDDLEAVIDTYIKDNSKQ